MLVLVYTRTTIYLTHAAWAVKDARTAALGKRGTDSYTDVTEPVDKRSVSLGGVE